MSQEKPFYVYVHRRATDGRVFYVGKGKGNRYKSNNLRNNYWHNIVNKHGFTHHIVMRFECEECAFSFERALIKHYGRSNLCNMTDGGEGASGVKQSDYTKELRASKIRGELHPFYGKKLSDEHKSKLSSSHIGISKGVLNPRAILDVIPFRHISGSFIMATPSEFRDISGLSSGGISRIMKGNRRHEKGWYVSDVFLSEDEVLGRGEFNYNTRKELISIINKDGIVETGTPLSLRKRLGLSQGHFDAVIRGERKSHKGWMINEKF